MRVPLMSQPNCIVPDSDPGPVPPIRCGVIGCGRMGRVHVERLRQTGRVEIAVLADADPWAAAALRDALVPRAEVADAPDDLLRHARLDAVVICSPTHLHVEQAAAALERGLHVLCEKPLADSRDGLDRLIELAAASERLTMLAYQRRFWGIYRTLRRELHSGLYGPIRAVAAHNAERWQQTIAGSWRDDPAQNPGGFLGDAGSHKLDALFYVAGLEPLEVFARSQTRGSRVDVVTSASALLRDPGQPGAEIPATLDFIGCAQQQIEDLTIHCADADLMIRDFRVWIAQGNDVRPLTPLEPTTDPATGFIELLLRPGSNPAPWTAAKPVWELTQLILDSARSGAPRTAREGAG